MQCHRIAARAAPEDPKNHLKINSPIIQSVIHLLCSMLSNILIDLSPFVSGMPQSSFHQTFISDRNAGWSDIGTPALAHNSEAAALQHQLSYGPPHDHSSVWELRLNRSQPHRTARWLFNISVTLDGSNFSAPWAWMPCAWR